MYYRMLVSILISLVGFAGGWFLHSTLYPPRPNSFIIHESAVVESTIHKTSYSYDELRCFTTAQPSLFFTQINDNTIRATAGLCDRTWYKDATIEVARDNRFIYYAGIAGVAVGGLVVYKILK